jgi:hypothetical protein
MAGWWLFARSLFWTVLFPGTVAGYIPWRYFGVREASLDPGSPRVLVALWIVLLGLVVLGIPRLPL